jgi:hypothetical protein
MGMQPAVAIRESSSRRSRCAHYGHSASGRRRGKSKDADTSMLNDEAIVGDEGGLLARLSSNFTLLDRRPRIHFCTMHESRLESRHSAFAL